jgi:hypothetical protein
MAITTGAGPHFSWANINGTQFALEHGSVTLRAKRKSGSFSGAIAMSTPSANAALSQLEGGNQTQIIVDPMDAADAMRVARLYGSRPEIVSRLSWAALVTLSSPTLAGAIRDALERRIAAGDKIDTPAIRAARGARQAGRTRRQAARPAVRMAA